MVSVDGVDFGVNGSADDNLGANISFGTYDYMAPDAASFVCSNGYFGENTDGDNDASNDSAECPIGEEKDTSYSYFAEDFLWGEAFLADSYSTLESFRYRVYSASVCTGDSSASSNDPGFGTLQGLVYKSGLINDMSVGDTLQGITKGTSTTAVSTSKIYVDDLENSSASLCP